MMRRPSSRCNSFDFDRPINFRLSPAVAQQVRNCGASGAACTFLSSPSRHRRRSPCLKAASVSRLQTYPTPSNRWAWHCQMNLVLQDTSHCDQKQHAGRCSSDVWAKLRITAGEGESQSCAHASACGVGLLRFSGPKFLQSSISQRPASGRSSLPQYEG